MRQEYITRKGVKVLVATTGSGAILLGAPAAVEASSVLSQIGAETFGPGGPGFVMFQFLIIGIVSWLMKYLLAAINKSAYADLIQVAALLACITIIGGLLWSAILAIARIAGIA